MAHRRLGRFLEHVLSFGHSNPIGLLSPQQRKHRLQLILLGHTAGELAHRLRLFGLLLFAWQRNQYELEQHLFDQRNQDNDLCMSP